MREEDNAINIGSYSNIGDVTISIRYYENILNDNDILDALGYTESEGCKEPIITDRETLTSGAITFRPEYSTVTELCGINAAWKGLYFPKEWILVSILLGQDGQFEVLSTNKNADYNQITRKFMETFRAI